MLAFSTSTTSHLRYHHVGGFPCSEIGIVEHGIGREDAHNANVVEVETLCHHLCAYEKVGFL